MSYWYCCSEWSRLPYYKRIWNTSILDVVSFHLRWVGKHSTSCRASELRGAELAKWYSFLFIIMEIFFWYWDFLDLTSYHRALRERVPNGAEILKVEQNFYSLLYQEGPLFCAWGPFKLNPCSLSLRLKKKKSELLNILYFSYLPLRNYHRMNQVFNMANYVTYIIGFLKTWSTGYWKTRSWETQGGTIT